VVGHAELAVREIPDLALRELAPKLAIAATVIEKLQARLYARVKEAPDNFPDWRFEPGQRKRSIDDTVKAAKTIIDSKRLTAARFLEACSIGITKLETILRKDNDLTIIETEKLLNELVGSLITVKPNRDSLVYDPKPKELANNEL
jgi:hypothetical protein